MTPSSRRTQLWGGFWGFLSDPSPDFMRGLCSLLAHLFTLFVVEISEKVSDVACGFQSLQGVSTALETRPPREQK